MSERKEEKLTAREKVILVVDGIAVITGVTLLGYSIHRTHKLNKLLSSAIGKVSEMTDVKISEEIVNAGVERAVNREVGNVAFKAAQACSEEIKEQVNKRVGEACKKSYSKIESEVAEKIASEIGKIYKDDLIEDIRAMAKEQIAEQFESKLDDVLESYNNNLASVNKIYQSIADKMAPGGKENKGIELKLS